MNDTTWEEYRDRCMAHGGTEEDARNTWELMQKIESTLESAAFAPPEEQYRTKIKLSRLFIDEWQEMVKEGDESIAAWLLAHGQISLAARVRGGDHWKWHHAQKKKP